MLSDDFPPLLLRHLDTGKSFPAARQAALEEMGLDGDLLSLPNNILAVEYCKAILAQKVNMRPLPIVREGSYHAEEADQHNPSATSVRNLMNLEQDWLAYVAPAAADIFDDAPLHTLLAGERAVLARLRTMTDSEFEALPYGSEGLWRKFMHACRSCAALEDIIAATKSKRYTRTRIDRMIMCAFLGITEEMLSAPVPYTRVLAFNDIGRAILKEAKKTAVFLNAGEGCDVPYWELEKRCGDLFGLFRKNGISPSGTEESRRVYYRKENL